MDRNESLRWSLDLSKASPEEIGELHFRLTAVELATELGVLEVSVKLRQLYPNRPVGPQTLRFWMEDYERSNALILGR